jgi:hypothetical protein
MVTALCNERHYEFLYNKAKLCKDDKNRNYYEFACICLEDVEDEFGFRPVYKIGIVLVDKNYTAFDYIINTNLEYNISLKKYRRDK